MIDDHHVAQSANPFTETMDPYLESTECIDWESDVVHSKASALASTANSTSDLAKKCFEFVRDEIRHSSDYKLNPVTSKASDVLHYRTGFCFAKSHLLAALLRANQIPAGLCYQRLALNDDASQFCLHGLNAVYLEQFGWMRVDARGDKPGISTHFLPPNKSMAFNLKLEGEFDLPEIYSKPLDDVLNVLNSSISYIEVNDKLPDIDPTTLDSLQRTA